MGLPHRILIDEAHYFLGRLDDPELFDRELGGHLLVTYRIADLSADVLDATDAVIVTQVTDRRQALALRGLAAPVLRLGGRGLPLGRRRFDAWVVPLSFRNGAAVG